MKVLLGKIPFDNINIKVPVGILNLCKNIE